MADANPCRGTTLDMTTLRAPCRSFEVGKSRGVADPKSATPERATTLACRYRYKRMKPAGALPLFGAPSKTGHRHHCGLPGCVRRPGRYRFLMSPGAPLRRRSRYPRPPTPRPWPGTGALPSPNRKGAALLGVKSFRLCSANAGVFSARSRRRKVAVFRGTGFGSAPRGGAAT